MEPLRVSALAGRVRGKVKRVISLAPIVRQWSETRYLAQRARHAERLPWLTSDRFDLVAQLRDEGIAVRNVSGDFSESVLAAADRFVARLAENGENGQGASFIQIPQSDIAADPTVFMWGLDEGNLDLAESYIGLPVRYLGVGVKVERADNLTAGLRQWHMDIEDRRMLKILIYLNDVDSGCGPFEYLDLATSARANRALKYTSGFVPDEAMNRVVDKSAWRTVSGSRLTAIFVDTCRIFHRAQPPITQDRYSMTFAYSSLQPFQVFPEYLLPGRALRGLGANLSLRQRAALTID